MSFLNKNNYELFNNFCKEKRAITFDEITLEDKPSNVHPNDVDLTSKISKNIILNGCGIMSSAMDTVTEEKLALELARNGGMGVIHRNNTPEEQAKMIKWVRQKINFGGMIDNPVVYFDNQRLSDLQNDIVRNGWTFTSFPIIDKKNNKLVGLITKDDMSFVEDENPLLCEIMRPLSNIITANANTTANTAYEIMKTNKIKKLPIVNDDGTLYGLFIWKDIRGNEKNKNLFSLDGDGHFLVAGAIGVDDFDGFERAKILIENGGCKVLVIDTSHGACKPVVDIIKKLRENWGDNIDIIAGNIASYDSAKYLLSQKYIPNALKVGISIGSICTTRLITGHGMPQLTAIFQVRKAIDEIGTNVSIIADGAIRYSGDIVKAIALGANGVMIGGLFGAAEESPAKIIIEGGNKYKLIRGMASKSAMEENIGSRNRYLSTAGNDNKLTNNQKKKIVPEGVEGLVRCNGTVDDIMGNLLGGIKSGFAHSGAKNIEEFRENAEIWLQSTAGIIEANPHDLKQVS